MKKRIVYLIFCLLFVNLLHISHAETKIVVLGDSLTEGLGVDSEFAFPRKLEEKLTADKLSVKVINGGISGSTTASGMSRLKWFLRAKPSIIVLALGANDGLRGLKVAESKKNLKAIIKAAKDKGIKIVLAGMRVPANYGDDYRKEFYKMYTDLVKEENVVFIPFLLDGVAGKKEYNIHDGIHPNRKGHEIIADTVYNIIRPLL